MKSLGALTRERFPPLFQQSTPGVQHVSSCLLGPFLLGPAKRQEGLFLNNVQILKALTGCDKGSKSFDLSVFNVSLTEICFKKLFTKIQSASTVGQASCPCWCVSMEPTVETTVLMLHLQPVPCLL